MKRLSVQEIIKAVDGILLFGNERDVVENISTDSRTIESDDMFFAITGDIFDGHDYIENVVNKGCKAIVVSSSEKLTESIKDINIILVSDTLKAYQDLAKYYRQLIDPIVIGVTGSVGKTSLKDMLYVISNDYYNTVCSFENENNHMGVPKTIFRMEENTEVLILEMGMNHKGEIRRLTEIGRPNIAGITNVGLSHIENFIDQNGIYEAKMEISDFFSEKNTLVVMGDDQYLKKTHKDKDYEVISVGTSQENDYVAEGARYIDDTHITFLIDYDKGVERFTLPIAGLYNSTTAGLATAIMSKLNISVSNCAHSLKKLKITPHRLQLIVRGNIKIIDDTYNASPASMTSAIEYLSAIQGSRKICVLADMKELGGKSVRLHRELGHEISKVDIDYLFTVGELGREIAESAKKNMNENKIFSFEDIASCTEMIKKIIKEGDGILVKGSHSMGMEKVVSELVKYLSEI